MSEQAAPPQRAGQSNAHQDDVRSHILVLFVDDCHGAVDRIVGLLRRRRANMQTLTIGRSELPDVARITVIVDDSEVAVEQLVEQLRKVVDVRHVINLSSAQAVSRELALIKVSSTTSSYSEIIELGHQFGAHTVDVTPQTVTLEVTGNEEKVTKLVDLLQPYGIREIARTGCVAMTRGPEDSVKM
ncbi:MAG TPA: acetolactate synthase small subunit [Ktedonobacteraceae bacterium]|nr:acetolactate synthase small subunit [Ktedonobacteraceae bacterium]